MATNLRQERLDAGPVICTDGFLLVDPRRDLSASEFIPVVVRDDPDALTAPHAVYQRVSRPRISNERNEPACSMRQSKRSDWYLLGGLGG